MNSFVEQLLRALSRTSESFVSDDRGSEVVRKEHVVSSDAKDSELDMIAVELSESLKHIVATSEQPTIFIDSGTTVQALAQKIGSDPTEIILELLEHGFTATIEQPLNSESLEALAPIYGYKVREIVSSDKEIPTSLSSTSLTAKNTARVFTNGGVAQICGVSADTVSRWFDLGQIQGYRLGPGGDRRIPYDSLRSFMMSHGIPLERLEAEQRCILVVDDDPYYLDIIPDVLSKLGEYKIIVASTGFDAGAQVVNHNPHLIILDIHLSDMDGRMVCQRVKSRPETRSTRILAISGYIEDDEVSGLKDYGFDDYLKKPFSIEVLSERVQTLASMPASKVARPRKVESSS